MNNTEQIKKSLNKRYRKEKRFRLLSLLAVLTGFACIFILLVDMFIKALPAFIQTEVKLDIHFSQEKLGVAANFAPEELQNANFRGLIKFCRLG
jgi:phosphate transport system permease protein